MNDPGLIAPSVRRAHRAIRRHQIPEDQIDHAILCAINVTLCLLSDGDDLTAEGFNRDIAASGGRALPSAFSYASQVSRGGWSSP